MKKYISILCITCYSVLSFIFNFCAPLNLQKDFYSLACEGFTNNKAIACSNNNVQNSTLYQKEVFLTFDDGPCVNNTRKILKVLTDNNVKATFFVVGIKGEENSKILKELSNSGMSIGIHTYSHNYKKVYKNLEFYLNDFQSCKNVIKSVTGKDPIPYIRLPGGSDNLVTNKSNLEGIKKALKEKGIKYVDWNVNAGDAEGKEISPDKVKRNVINQCQEKKLAVILMHDTYYGNCTVEALPDIIKYLKSQGYVFRTFDELTPTEESVMQKIGVINKV